MQDQYVGDIGDFGKYGLLRHLTGMRGDAAPEDALRLGVIWYLFPDGGNNDGKFTKYLCNPSARDKNLSKCDTKLYDQLYKIVVEEKNRKVVRVQESGILPENTAYYERCLSYEPGKSPSSKKLRREAWLEGTLEATAKAKVVFVDPDNGIASEKVEPWHNKGPKYVFMEDLNRFYKRGQSLVIYHHMGRQGTATEQIKRHAKRLQQYLDLPDLPWSLWYHRGTARAYFIVPHERNRTVLERRLASFLDSPWCANPSPHFQKVI